MDWKSRAAVAREKVAIVQPKDSFTARQYRDHFRLTRASGDSELRRLIGAGEVKRLDACGPQNAACFVFVKSTKK